MGERDLFGLLSMNKTEEHRKKDFLHFFVQLGFNLSNGVTDTLESSTILLYLETRKSIYTQQCGELPSLIKWFLKR